jgi:hypothetical protein
MGYCDNAIGDTPAVIPFRRVPWGPIIAVWLSDSAPHPELYIRLGEALGSTREKMLNITPLAESLALRSYWLSAVDMYPFVEALAALSVGGEGQVPGLKPSLPSSWSRNTNSPTSNRPFGGFTKKLTENMGVAIGIG